MKNDTAIEDRMTDSSVVLDTDYRSAEEDGPLSKRDIKRNMVFLVMLDAIFTMGWADFQLALVPLLVFLGASNTLIGFVQGSLFMALPGVIISPWISTRFRLKRWYLIVTNIPYIGAVGLAGLVVVLSQRFGTDNGAVLVYVVVMMVLHQLFTGFAALPHQEYVAACIPMSWRGRYSGFSLTAGSILSIGSAAVGGLILHHYAKPMAFGYLFLMTWVISQGGYVLAAFAKEVPTPVEKAPRPWSKAMLKAAIDDKRFVWFSTVHTCGVGFIAPVFGFVAAYGFKELKMAAATAAIIAIVAKVGSISSSWLMGMLVDKLGPRTCIPWAGL